MGNNLHVRWGVDFDNPIRGRTFTCIPTPHPVAQTPTSKHARASIHQPSQALFKLHLRYFTLDPGES